MSGRRTKHEHDARTLELYSSDSTKNGFDPKTNAETWADDGQNTSMTLARWNCTHQIRQKIVFDPTARGSRAGAMHA